MAGIIGGGFGLNRHPVVELLLARHGDDLAAGGGQSAVKAVYTDPKYVTYRPWNRAWAGSLDWQKDVWHVPQFFELLTEQQDQFDLAITGKQDAKTTLDNVAKFQQDLLTQAGLIK